MDNSCSHICWYFVDSWKRLAICKGCGKEMSELKQYKRGSDQ